MNGFFRKGSACSLTVSWGFQLLTSASVSWVNSVSALPGQSFAQTKLSRPWAPRMPRSPKHTPRHSAGGDTQRCLWVPYHQVTYGVKSSGTRSSDETRTFSDSSSLGTPRNAPSPPAPFSGTSPTEASLPRVKPENTHFLLNILILPAASDACHLNSLQCFQTVYDSSAEQGAHKCSTRTTRKGGTWRLSCPSISTTWNHERCLFFFDP